jgi:dethiobiotin synthetase
MGQLVGVNGLKMTGCGLFVTGTDTDVGKTAAAVSIVRSLVRNRGLAGVRVGVYKPVASGVPSGGAEATDAARLWEAAGRPLSIETVCPQMFAAAISPPQSARAEGRRVDENVLLAGFETWRNASDIVIVEGAGGLFSPLGDTMLNADLARDLGLPLVVVDAARLGTIGRTLAVAEAAAARGLRLAAVVLSQVAPWDENPDDPESPWAIARDSANDLADRLRPVTVTMLAHNATAIEPDLDWLALAQAGTQRAPNTMPP